MAGKKTFVCTIYKAIFLTKNILEVNFLLATVKVNKNN